MATDKPQYPHSPDSPPTVAAPLIEIHGITKKYGSLYANRDVRLDIREGEIHALAGENGAGKTTLMNILFGRTHADSGSIRFRGKPLSFRSPRDAIRAGIGMVHQNILIFPQLSVLENIVIGFEPSRMGFLNTDSAIKKIARLQDLFGFDLDPAAGAGQLSFARRQQIELLRILYHGARVLILDEPTSLLAPHEIERLLELLRSLRSEGRTVVFISHRLSEVFSISDRITVLRHGSVVATKNAEATCREEIAALMVESTGWMPDPTPADRAPLPDRPPVLEIRNVGTAPSAAEPGLKDFSLSIAAGEIFGIGGVVGNGQRMLARILSGQVHAQIGTILFEGADIAGLSVADRLRAGISRLPENPGEEALMPGRPIWENFLLGSQRRKAFQRRGFTRTREIIRFARDQVHSHGIAAPDVFGPLSSLSGGNQQKVGIARTLDGPPKLVILEQPARGLDLHAAGRLHNLIRDLSAQGMTFLVLSYDLDELLALCDRIAVIFRGTIVGMADRKTASRMELGEWMVGIGKNQRS